MLNEVTKKNCETDTIVWALSLVGKCRGAGVWTITRRTSSFSVQ